MRTLMDAALLRCPKCQHPLKQTSATYARCDNGHTFAIDNGVFVLEKEYKVDKVYTWGKKLRDPKESLKLDQTASAIAKKKARGRSQKMVRFIRDNIPKQNITLLDIATGRGLLLRKLLPTLSACTIYLNDISTNVLVGTTKLVQPLLGNNTIIPIQSTTTRLPFSSNSFLYATSYGINNVRETEKALEEIYRVLKPDGQFVFSVSLIEKDSPSYNWLIKRGNKPSALDIIDRWQPAIKKIGFAIAKTEILFDGPVEKVPLDLLPRVDGERRQNVGIVLKKILK